MAQDTKRRLTEPSKRLEAVPAYMFAEIERRVAEKRKAGIDVISLGIGDPDRPTYPHIIEAMRAAVAEPPNHRYPTNRGRQEFREAFAGFYDSRFGVAIDSWLKKPYVRRPCFINRDEAVITACRYKREFRTIG